MAPQGPGRGAGTGPGGGPSMPAAAGDPRDAVFDVAGLERRIGRRAGRSSVQVLAISFLKVAVLFGGIAVIARLVPPAEYGIFALAMPAVALAQTLSTFGLPQAVVQRRAIGHAEASTLFWLNLAFAAIAAAAVVALAGPAARIFDSAEVAPVFRALAGAVLLAAAVGFYGGILRRRLRTARFEAIVLGGEVAGLAAAIAAALAGASYWALVIQQFTVQIVTAAGAVAATRWWPSSPARARLGAVWDAVGFGGWVAGVGLLNKVMTYAGTAVAGAQIGPAASGLYSRAVRLGNLPPLRIMQPLSGTIVPTLSRLQDDPPGLRAVYERLISRANLMLMPAAVMLAAGAEPVVALLLGPDWAAAAPLLAWMSLLTLRAGANHGLRYAMLAAGASRALFLVTLLRTILVVAAIVLAAPHGLVTMVAAYMLTELFVTLPLTIAVAMSRTPLTLACLWRASLAPMALAAALAAALILGANPHLETLPAALHLAALVAAVGAAYALRVALSAPLRRDVASALARIAELRRRPAAAK